MNQSIQISRQEATTALALAMNNDIIFIVMASKSLDKALKKINSAHYCIINLILIL